MDILKFDIQKKLGGFKPLNATNGGPWYNRRTNDQLCSNFESYKAARIPYQRNHDSAVHGVYGGPYSYDITCIFPRFEADVNDPKSYDFECTDEAILSALEAGTQTFFRLGQTIEHQIKKHGTIPPEDFNKWAVICEHIIRHYNEGWANGYNLNMEYWEIWNEPDLDPDDCDNKRTWGGTEKEFFNLYEIAAKHLKKCFPNLKIGGPALACDEEWAERFLCEMQKRNVPIDFFSWHYYGNDPKQLVQKAERLKEMLVKYGYGEAESNLNEWNYIKGWTDEFVYSLKMINGIKGAAFIMAVMSVSQASSIDMLMYYDTRPSRFNGVFDFYTAEPISGYYPMLWYGKFYDMKDYIKSDNEIDDIYSLCGVDDDGKVMSVITYYSNNDDAENKNIQIDFGKAGEYEIYLLDGGHNGELVNTTSDLNFDMKVNSCILIKEK